MALIICTECGKEFSDKAKACPQCACPIEYILDDINKTDRKNYHENNKSSDDENQYVYEESTYSNDSVYGSSKTSYNTNSQATYRRQSGMEFVKDIAKCFIDDYNTPYKKFNKFTDTEKINLLNNCVCDKQSLIIFKEEFLSRCVEVYGNNWEMLFQGSVEKYSNKNNLHLDNMVAGMDVYIETGEFPEDHHRINSFKISDMLKQSMMENSKVAKIYLGNSKWGELYRKLTIKLNSYYLDGWGIYIEGDLLNTKYTIFDRNKCILGYMYRKSFKKGFGYVVDYYNNANDETVILVALAISMHYTE